MRDLKCAIACVTGTFQLLVHRARYTALAGGRGLEVHGLVPEPIYETPIPLLQYTVAWSMIAKF